jgi:hypothetical protein
MKTFSTTILTAILGISLVALFPTRAIAQCTGCTQSVTTNGAAITVSAGQVVCLAYSGTFTQSVTFNGGTLCISPATTVSSAITMNGTGYLNIYGKMTGALTLNNGSNAIVYSGGTLATSSATFNGGNLTVNSGGTANFSSAISISGGTITSNGTFTATGLTNNGGTTTLSGTTTISGAVVSNNGTLTINGPAATISGSFTANSGGTTNLDGGVSIGGSMTNYGTINLTGPLSISGSLTMTGTFNATATGCNSVSVGGTITNYSGTFNGNGYNLAVSPASTGYSNGAYGAPTEQPTGLALALSSDTVKGTFTLPSASIANYLVIRYIGTAATTDVPANGAAYAVGGTVGSSTVAAIVAGATTGTKAFADVIPAGDCSKNVYYRIFSYNGSGTCSEYYTTGPLTGSIALPAATAASITASGATTFCSGSSVVLTASAGASYKWSTAAVSQAITATTAATYTVTVTNALGCTVTASKAVTVNTAPTVTATAANSTICSGSAISITTTVGGSTSYTYRWSGPNSYTASISAVSISSATTAASGTYSLTVTGANTCTTTASAAINVAGCVTVSGSLFDDANGNGILDAAESETNNRDSLYSILADSTGKVMASSLVVGNGAFSFSGIYPNTAGMTIAVNTVKPAVGAASPGYGWPAKWISTAANYGTNNAAGTGIYATTGEKLPVKTSTLNITNILIGFDQTPTSVVYNYTVSYPHDNTKASLVAVDGSGLLSGTDPEDGAITKKFEITSVAQMSANKLYYDADSNGILETGEQMSSGSVITNFVASRLYVSFVGTGSTSATFSYSAVDAAGKISASPSSYTITWAGALPVKLISFTAEQASASTAELVWATASEIDNAYFEVERSADGEVWASIGKENGAGTTDVQTNYTMMDKSPLNGVNYYRLKQVDVDGNTSYSNIAQVTFSGISTSEATGTTLSVYPNPGTKGGAVNFKLSDPTETISNIVITNSIGQQVYAISPAEGQSVQSSGLDLPAGVYIVSIHTVSNSMLSSRLVIQ